MSHKTVGNFLAACNSRRLHEENKWRFNHSKHVRFYWAKKHFVSEWYFTKNHEIGSLVVRKVKNIVRLIMAESWAWTRLRVEEQLLIFSSCLSPGLVKNLQKFINFCLRVGHSANLKHSKSHKDNRPVTPVQYTKSAHRGMRTIYNSCRFDIGRFRVEPTAWFKEGVYIWVTHFHIAVPIITCSFCYA